LRSRCVSRASAVADHDRRKTPTQNNPTRINALKNAR
jgi:hypothetical protein